MNKKTCIGAGLVALDVILNGNPQKPPKIHAGGTCGNVMAILSYLGWESYPIARLTNNNAAEELEKDLSNFNVNLSLLDKSVDGSTPIIIHRILTSDTGEIKHRFEFKDPDNGKWLPRYKAVLNKDVDHIIKKANLSNPNVYFFDKISRSTINFAKHYKKEGAIIYFEPSSIGSNKKLFDECLEIVDIIKFSSERINGYPDLEDQKVPLEIVTLGEAGIKYRFMNNKSQGNWIYREAKPVVGLQDTAGAGDWCSAGIISILGREDNFNFDKINVELIDHAIDFGQFLGAVNCLFDGARGLMYILEKEEVTRFYKTNKEISRSNVLKNKSSIINKNRKSIKVSSLYKS